MTTLSLGALSNKVTSPAASHVASRPPLLASPLLTRAIQRTAGLYDFKNDQQFESVEKYDRLLISSQVPDVPRGRYSSRYPVASNTLWDGSSDGGERTGRRPAETGLRDDSSWHGYAVKNLYIGRDMFSNSVIRRRPVPFVITRITPHSHRGG